MAPFWRVPFPSVRCWREDTFACCPWIHVRATSRLLNGPAVLQKIHRGAVAQDVWRDPLVSQARAPNRSSRRVLGDHSLDGVGAEGGVPSAGEQRIIGLPVALFDPGRQGSCGLGSQRRAPLFAALPRRADVGTGAEFDVG